MYLPPKRKSRARAVA